jgi:hypothetical protein
MISERYPGWSVKKLCFRHTGFSSSGTDTVLDLVRKMRHFRPTYELREKFEYNNLVSFCLLTHKYKC